MHQASFCQNQRPVQINLHRKPKHRSRTENYFKAALAAVEYEELEAL